MKIKDAMAVLNRFLAAYGNVEIGVLGTPNGKCGGLMDIGMVEVEVEGGAQIACLLSTQKLKCSGCELCRTGHVH